MTEQTYIPDGFRMNAKGHLVPITSIKPIDSLRDETVIDMVQKALDLQQQLKQIKTQIFNQFEDFVNVSAQEYQTKIGGEKGNTTLYSFDGKYKIQFAIQDNLVFDERLQVAKALVDECLHEWTADSNDNIKAIINNAFQVDKEGKINTRRVLGLRSLNIDDEKWKKAMQAIADATQVISSKEYIRFCQRDEHGKYQAISLDFANI